MVASSCSHPFTPAKSDSSISVGLPQNRKCVIMRALPQSDGPRTAEADAVGFNDFPDYAAQSQKHGDFSCDLLDVLALFLCVFVRVCRGGCTG